mmetsp:Transcript_78149/g.131233  ORF Transcript_78149/g.131233 Transcript_78149/m.131233 type:complete len:113 (-) Transcript_78149:838-1176(-)
MAVMRVESVAVECEFHEFVPEFVAVKAAEYVSDKDHNEHPQEGPEMFAHQESGLIPDAPEVFPSPQGADKNGDGNARICHPMGSSLDHVNVLLLFQGYGSSLHFFSDLRWRK